jgi:hypothetical protein
MILYDVIRYDVLKIIDVLLGGVMYVELLKCAVMLKYTAKYNKSDGSAQVRMNYRSSSQAKITSKTENKYFSIRRFSHVHFSPRKIC